MGACDNPRTYLPVPDLLAAQVRLPPVPLDVDDWQGMQRFLAGVRAAVSGPAENTASGAAPAAQVQHFVATAKIGGSLLTWDLNRNGGYYIIYRGVTNDLSQAYAVAVIPEGNVARGQFLDPCGQNTVGTLLYYWIEPYTAQAVKGPVSVATLAAVSCNGTNFFSDNFTRSDQTGWGGSWITANMVAGASGSIVGLPSILTNRGCLSFASSPGGNGGLACIPLVVPGLLNQNQYAQAKFVSDTNAVFVVTGPMVLCNAGYTGTASAYWLALQQGTANYTCQRGSINGAGSTTISVSPKTFAAGDTMKISAVIAAASTTLTIYRNGVLDQTIVDSNAARLSTGLPGIMFFGGQLTTEAVIYDDFVCGSPT